MQPANDGRSDVERAVDDLLEAALGMEWAYMADKYGIETDAQFIADWQAWASTHKQHLRKWVQVVEITNEDFQLMMADVKPAIAQRVYWMERADIDDL